MLRILYGEHTRKTIYMPVGDSPAQEPTMVAVPLAGFGGSLPQVSQMDDSR